MIERHASASTLQIIFHNGSSLPDWRFVPSADNPADYSSRGIHAYEKEKWETFFFGPRFLQLPEDKWPKTDLGSVETISIFTMTADDEPNPPSFFADMSAGTSFWYWKRCRIAILARSARRWHARVNARMRNSRHNLPMPMDISMDDLEEAEKLLIREVQE